MHWAASYYEPMSDIEAINLTSLQSRTEVVEGSGVKSSLNGMSAEDLVDTTDTTVWMRSGQHLRNIPREIYWHNTQRALFETGEVLPNVDVLVLWCDMTPSIVLWAIRNIHDRMLDAQNQQKGKGMREIKIVKLERANHFVRAMQRSDFR